MAYDIPKPKPWGWKVSSYIWTKSIAAGAALVPALMRIAGRNLDHPLLTKVAPMIALAFLALTGVLLVADLKRPERFWTILVRPQWRSWLARGAFIITVYGFVLAAWAVACWLRDDAWTGILAWPVAALAIATAVYTAFLFAQCEGRDLWQSRLLSVELVVHALVAGLGVLFVAAPLAQGSSLLTPLLTWFGAGLWLSALLALLEGYRPHPTANARAAALALVTGPDAPLFWIALAAAVLPAAVLWFAPAQLAFAVAPFTLLGLWLQGHALVVAGQAPPIS